MLSRREFLKFGAIGAAGLFMPKNWLPSVTRSVTFSHSSHLEKFVQPLRKVGAGISVAQPDAVPPAWCVPGAVHYTIDIGQYEDLLHPDLSNPTRLWGFGQGYAPGNKNWTSHLGGVIAVKRGTPVQITFRNHLPTDHIIPVDPTIMGADGPVNRADVHLHGGFVPWISDGGPHAAWDPNGNHGESFLNNQVLRPGPGVPSNEAEYYYPNNQSARLMWYHDHTFGNTRINAYAGIASAYVIYDDYELSLVANHHLPAPIDPRTEYLVFQDKIFVSESINVTDPTWSSAVKNSRPGDLWYAHYYDPARWEQAAGTPLPADPSVIPEFFGDTMLVNGSVYPYLEVEPRQYRFRMLNACNARFLNPRLVRANPANESEPRMPEQAGPAWIQIGTEGGFLPAPVTLDSSTLEKTLLLAPAERADLIVDFRNVEPDSILILYNDAAAPYPMGDDLNDYYYPGNAVTPKAIAGRGPNTRTLLQIRVKALSGDPDPEITLPAALTPSDPFLLVQKPGVPTPIPDGVHVRYLTLNETSDAFGRLIQNLGTAEAVAPGVFGQAYEDTPTEVIKAGTTEVWEILNLTGDVHPIHFHLVNVHVLSRQGFDPTTFTGGAPSAYVGDPIAPDLNELGWKETVRMYPNQVTRVLMRFTLPTVPFKVPMSPRTGGHEYVWHCHILEHEEHDMMRPLIVEENKVFLPLTSR
jgi:spore coat protein A, manganese oxidase